MYEQHVELGGRMVSFGGFMLPVQYPSGILQEHAAVRNACGLFDVSHMGELILTGNDALLTVQHLVSSDCSGMVDGQIKYGMMINQSGGIVDDLLVYRLSENAYYLVVNASNHLKDYDFLRSNLLGDTRMLDITDEVSLLALQGPFAEEILRRAGGVNLPAKVYTFSPHVMVAGIPCMVSRTGYTGEDGFEIFCTPLTAVAVWQGLMDAGKDCGLMPCGLGARDTLRIEAAMPLYGHEMDETVTPFEVGLGRYVCMNKDFLGLSALQRAGAPSSQRIGLKLIEKGIARDGATVQKDGQTLGVVTSGTHSPTLGYGIAMARVHLNSLEIGDEVQLDVRGRMLPAQVVPLPFYKRQKR